MTVSAPPLSTPTCRRSLRRSLDHQKSILDRTNFHWHLLGLLRGLGPVIFADFGVDLA